jgi:transcription elongation factor Elf1
VRTSSEERRFRCSACGAEKAATDFSFADQERRILNAYCRVCHAAYRHAHYVANKSDYVRRAIAQTRARRDENRRQVLLYLAAHPCVDCGNENAVTLEFDHRDPAEKLTEVSRLIVNRRWPRVLAEIEKCDVRCINCHRRKTGREFGWAKVVAT